MPEVSTPPPTPADRPRRRGLIVLALAAYLATVWVAAGWVYRGSVDQLASSGRYQLDLYVSHLQGLLARFEYLPALLASNERVRGFLRDPTDAGSAPATNRYLEQVNAISGASDTYLMTADGTTVAASNWQLQHSFVGNNYGWRPYFQQAMAGGLGRYYALGTSSHQRGYYLSYPVREGGTILGVVVVKVDMADVEQAWLGGPDEVLVTDPDGVAFIATQRDWRLRTLAVLTSADRERLRAGRRYLDALLAPLPVLESDPLRDGLVRMKLRLSDERTDAVNFLVQAQAMPAAGWTVHVLTPMTTVRNRLLGAFAVSSLAYAALLLLTLYLRQRRKRQLERTRCQAEAQQALKAAHDQLERRVEERTAALRREVEERRSAEAALRRTQDELIQAAKLAVIGQMSAGISHELNQPLAALRAYADNARMLLDQAKTDSARWNLTQISELTDRMAQISSQLKLFARKTNGDKVWVSVQGAIDASCRILRPQLQKSAATVHVHVTDAADAVLADPVQLEQVLVNLIANAVNAMEPQELRTIAIDGVVDAGRLRLTVRDNGPGIAEESMPCVFDPFYTTREAGLGLGLSISRRIVEGLGGRLTAANHPDGGAVFTLSLPLAPDAAADPESAEAQAHE